MSPLFILNLRVLTNANANADADASTRTFTAVVQLMQASTDDVHAHLFLFLNLSCVCVNVSPPFTLENFWSKRKCKVCEEKGKFLIFLHQHLQEVTFTLVFTALVSACVCGFASLLLTNCLEKATKVH